MTAPTVDDYEARLAERVAQWEAQNPDQASELRLSVRRQAGLLEPPPAGSFRAQVLERYFHEAVRELKGWPTLRQWTKTQ